MSEKHPHSPASELEREFELERMILFSDAIFAIAITLMAIDVKWPEIPENLKGVDIGRLLHPTVIQFVVFIISFLFVGRAWKLHLRLFRQLKNYNQGLLNLNLLYLFSIVIFPFTASGILGHIRNGFAYPYLFYVFNIAAVGFSDFLITRYIFIVKPDLSVPGQEEEKKFIYTRAKYNAMSAVLIFFLMLLVAILFPGNADYLAYAFCVYPVVLRITNKKLRKFKPHAI
jgi:uncharacterized membrane protein